MLHSRFQACKPSGSEEEDFLIFFYVFLWFELGSPGKEPSWILGPYLNKIGKRPLDNATDPISSI